MLSDVQLFNLVLVKEIDEICRKYGIEYYLAGGSVIGVLRHKGFIPWDDDMDLYMTRDNWIKFREAFDKEKPADRTLESSDIDPNYPNMIAKYTSTNTTAIYKNLLSGKYAAGIIVDILILDPVPGDAATQQKHLKNLLLYSEFVNRYYVFSHRFDVDVKFESALAREKKIGHEAIVREYEQLVTQYSEEESDTYVLRWGGVPHTFPKDMFGTPKMMPFEGIMLPVPEKSFMYLSQLYGEDWVQLPTLEDERSHEAVFSIEKPYPEFFKEFKAHFDAKEYLEVIMNRKRNRIIAGRSYRRVQDGTLEFESRRIMMRYDKLDAEHNLRAMYKEGKYDELQELFDEFFRSQCNGKMLGNKYYGGVYRYFHPKYADIGDDLLWIAVELLCRRGRLYHPKRILEAREFAKGKLTSELQDQMNLIRETIQIIDAFEQGRYEETIEGAEAITAQKPDWINLIKLQILALEKLGCTDKPKFRTLIEAGKLTAPEDGDWLKFEGDTYLGENKEHAEKLYEQARQTTRNGATLLQIDEYFAQKNGSATETELVEESEVKASDPQAWPTEDELDDVQAIHLQLMKEVAEICKRASIPYFLAGRTALWAYVNHSVTSADTSPYIMIHVEDATKFVDAFNESHPENRLLDSLLTNNRYPTFSFRYVNTTTLCLSTRQLENFEDHGLYVHIAFIEHEPDYYTRRATSFVKTGWYSMNSLKVPKAHPHFDGKTGSTLVGKGIFKSLENIYSGSSKSYQVNDAALKRSEIDAHMLVEPYTQINVCGYSFTTFSNIEGYLKKLFDWRYEEVAKKPKEMSVYRVIDTTLSYREYYERNKDLINDIGYREAVLENRSFNKLNLKYARRIAAEWKTAMFIEEKWELEKRYEQDEQLIAELYEKGSYSELIKVLVPYIDHIIALRAKVVPFYNEWLGDICAVCLYETKQYSKLEKFMEKRRRAAIWEINERL